ncbi:MAG TPA: acyltransferase domain-containing protein, partial [Acidimicrobiales bacterium]|nr:acyltransferase domain-containing protein [Acidimicrobiales bacterium]
ARRGAGTGADDATRLFVATGDDLSQLAARLGDDEAVLAGSDLHALGDPGPVRLAIADPTPKRLELARKVVARGQPWRGRNDVWFAPEGLIAAGGRVAFAFPGIEPTFDARVDDVARHFGVGAELVERSSDLERQGATIMYVGRLLTEALAGLNIRPDVVVGHSLGEWTAMLVAGAVTREAIDRFVHGIADGDLVLPDLVFLALGCGVDVAEAAIADLPDIAVSHDNCPHQVIVCGSEASVAIAQERLKAQRVLGQVLPFRTGFHTPMFADYLQPFEDALGTLPIHRPTVPLYSSVTGQRFPEGEAAMRDLGRRLYIERVRFRELVETLYADGVRVFVQPGVGSVVGFVGDTLHDREHLAVAGAAPKRSGMGQLTRVAAALFVEGAAS